MIACKRTVSTIQLEHCRVTPNSCLLDFHLWFPGETTGFFRLIISSLCLSFAWVLISECAENFRSRCGWAHIQELMTRSHRALLRLYQVIPLHSLIEFSPDHTFHFLHQLHSLEQEGGHWAFFSCHVDGAPCAVTIQADC